MAFLIGPCCSHRHLGELRRMLGKGGTAEFEGYGDLSITELLPPLVNHYNGTVLVIVAPTLPDQAANVIEACMRKEWAVVDGSGKISAVRHLTIVTDLSKEKSPMASQWLKGNPFGGRLTLVDKIQDDTAILLPDFAITGPVNMRYGEHFTAEATTDVEKIRNLWMSFLPKSGSNSDLSQESAENADRSKDDLQQDAADKADAAESPADGGSQAGDAPAENGDGSKDDLQPESSEEKPVRKKAARKA